MICSAGGAPSPYLELQGALFTPVIDVTGVPTSKPAAGLESQSETTESKLIEVVPEKLGSHHLVAEKLAEKWGKTCFAGPDVLDRRSARTTLYVVC